MSKKKSRWTPRPAQDHKPVTEPRPQASGPVAQAVSPAEDLSPISPAQLAANRANSLFSTGPCTDIGKAKSSQNAVKSALTGRTVLLPTDDVEEYAAFVAEFQRDLKPVGARECELVQMAVDCHWRLRRIQELEYALYAHGEEQFAEAFAHLDSLDRHSKIVLQTHLTYQKELRNLHIQEARLDRKRRNALTELHELQSERNDAANQSQERSDWSESNAAPFASEAEFFAALDAGYVPPRIAAALKAQTEVAAEQNGFVFSNGNSATFADPSRDC